MDMLTITDLKKSFGAKTVVDGLSFSIPKNSIFGFVGQNGAGKTTTMKMILGLLKADAGEILVDGQKVVYGNTPTNRMIGYLPDVPEFYNYMTPKEYLTFCGEITGIPTREIKPRVEELLNQVGLGEEKHRIKGFSRGMKQRLGVAQALMGRPKLLICDEPTSALDPMGRKELMDILVASKEETTIMFSTHILSDVERICDRIAFLHQGKLAMSGSVADIKKLKAGNEYEVVFHSKEDLELMQKYYERAQRKDEYSLLLKGENDDFQKELFSFMLDHEISVEKIEKCEATLEGLFMEVVGK